jgi:hypothetical protein
MHTDQVPLVSAGSPVAGSPDVEGLPASGVVLKAAVAEQQRVGPVVTVLLAARVIGVSRQRVYQFLKEGRLRRSALMRGLISVRSLQSFLAVPRGCGLRWQQGDLFAQEVKHE